MTVLKRLPSEEILMDKLRKTIAEAWNVGNKLHMPRINKWLDNFTGNALINDVGSHDASKQLEQQIALFLLCNFIYYNENEIKYLAKKMFINFLHSVFISQSRQSVSETDFDELLNNTQFTYLGDVSESSSYLLYIFRQENDIVKTYFRERPCVKNVVFLDDFSLTGTQARDYLIGTPGKNYSDSKIAKYTNGEKIYILLMIATDEAVLLLSEIPNVVVIPCITLDSKSKAFSPDSMIFEGYEKKYKEYAKKMCVFYGTNLVDTRKSSPLGFGGCGYMFGAYYNIPDNTLPIFWSSKNGWSYLFKRYDKKYGSDGLSFGGHYV